MVVFRSFDVSKQIIGQMFVHGVNVLISGIVAHLSSGNACVLYFLNILIDTTLGASALPFKLLIYRSFARRIRGGNHLFYSSSTSILPHGKV